MTRQWSPWAKTDKIEQTDVDDEPDSTHAPEPDNFEQESLQETRRPEPTHKPHVPAPILRRASPAPDSPRRVRLDAAVKHRLLDPRDHLVQHGLEAGRRLETKNTLGLLH